MALLIHVFTVYIYQPFFNILIGIYWLLGEMIGEYDIGLAVIVFAVVVRILMLPLNFAGDRSAKEKQEIADKVKKVEEEFKHDPVRLKKETKKAIKSNLKAVISETIIIAIQAIIVIMLYRIFKTGLQGADLHLLYDFMPVIKTPINLMFLGEFDLSRTNYTLNVIQSLLIFLLETLNIAFLSTPTSRRDFISLAIFLPLASFIVFAFLPSGKKLFIITSLIFSIFLVLIKQLIYWYQNLFLRSITPATDSTSNQPPQDTPNSDLSAESKKE